MLICNTLVIPTPAQSPDPEVRLHEGSAPNRNRLSRNAMSGLRLNSV